MPRPTPRSVPAMQARGGASPAAASEFIRRCTAGLQLQPQLMEPAVVLLLQDQAASGDLPALLATAVEFFGLGCSGSPPHSSSRLRTYLQQHSAPGSTGAAWAPGAALPQAAEAAAAPSEAALAVLADAAGRARQGEPQRRCGRCALALAHHARLETGADDRCRIYCWKGAECSIQCR
jgi:hypothetical protein